jgi:hypothetical protein
MFPIIINGVIINFFKKFSRVSRFKKELLEVAFSLFGDFFQKTEKTD